MDPNGGNTRKSLNFTTFSAISTFSIIACFLRFLVNCRVFQTRTHLPLPFVCCKYVKVLCWGKEGEGFFVPSSPPQTPPLLLTRERTHTDLRLYGAERMGNILSHASCHFCLCTSYVIYTVTSIKNCSPSINKRLEGSGTV